MQETDPRSVGSGSVPGTTQGFPSNSRAPLSCRYKSRHVAPTEMQKDGWWDPADGRAHPAKRRAPEAWWRYTRHTTSSTAPANGSLHTLAGVAFLAWHLSSSLASGIPSRLLRLIILRLNGFFRGARASMSQRRRKTDLARLLRSQARCQFNGFPNCGCLDSAGLLSHSFIHNRPDAMVASCRLVRNDCPCADASGW